MFDGVKTWARGMKKDVVALYLASRDPRTPWLAKMLAFAIAGYALSPIDLIPDFIPVVGYLDDLIIVPLGILLIVKLIPPDLMAEFRATAAQNGRLPANWVWASLIVVIWIGCLVALGLWMVRHFR